MTEDGGTTRREWQRGAFCIATWLVFNFCYVSELINETDG